MSSHTRLWLFCALPLLIAARDPAFALDASKVLATTFHPLAIKTEGRKGTRLYRPDESADYDALVEGEEKVTGTHEPTVEERLDQCMASWDAETHITKNSWRQICEREIKNNE